MAHRREAAHLFRRQGPTFGIDHVGQVLVMETLVGNDLFRQFSIDEGENALHHHRDDAAAARYPNHADTILAVDEARRH